MILVTGGSGQVGTELIYKLVKLDRKFDAPTRTQLSIDSPEQIEAYLENRQLEAIFHLAAETNVDFCETNREIALTRNFEATRVLTEAANKQHIPLVFVSSSSVVSGDGQFLHSESANFSPANYYGHTKMLAEQFITSESDNFLILRAGWMLGHGSKVKKFAEVAYEKISMGEPFSAVFDKFGSLSDAASLANLILDIYDRKVNDTLHYASFTPCSRYEVAKHIKHFLGSDSEIQPVSSSNFVLPAPRGFSEGLNGTKIEELLMIKPKTWEEELTIYLEAL